MGAYGLEHERDYPPKGVCADPRCQRLLYLRRKDATLPFHKRPGARVWDPWCPGSRRPPAD